MQTESTVANVSQDYATYMKKVEDFNSYLNATISDIYKKLTVITQSINELNQSRKNNVDPAYVAKLDAKINSIASDINNVISSFNDTLDRINGNYKDAFERIGKLNSNVDTISTTVGKLSTELTKTVNAFNDVSKRVSETSDANAITVAKMNDALGKFSEMVNANITDIKSGENELSSKVHKLTEDFYSGLPNVNKLSDDVSDLKRLHSNINSRFENITNITNALAVESNGLNLKLDTLSKEFQNIQQGVVDTQKHVMDFINIARSVTSNISSYNPETLNITIKKDEDRLDTIDKELTRVLENYDSLNKGMSTLSGKISDMSVVKNAAKLFESVQSVSKSMEETETRVNAQSSKMEIMFNEISTYMNKFIDINSKLSDAVKKISDTRNDMDKLRSNLSLFATKEDIIELHNKIDNLSKSV